MKISSIRFSAWVVAVCAACGPARQDAASPAGPGPDPAVLEQAARADSVRQFYTEADVDFMTGMIHHHAQALVMARMAPTHGASESIRTLAARIINGQRDEIATMQRWLRERNEPVPTVDEDGHTRMPGMAQHGDMEMEHGAAHEGHGDGHAMGGMADMAGMLTPEQMARLEAASGPGWDQLFLTYMIQHHQGALVMVEDLFATHGAGQGDAIFKIASDIGVDQATEIDRMQRMLQDLVFGSGRSP
jgi:uncharacterized protein (DUF305 family)